MDDAETAIDALARLQDSRYDLVLLDIRMPGSIRAGRGESHQSRQPAPARRFRDCLRGARGEAFEVEADDYLLKPVSERRLRRALERVHAARPSVSAQPTRPSRAGSTSRRDG